MTTRKQTLEYLKVAETEEELMAALQLPYLELASPDAEVEEKVREAREKLRRLETLRMLAKRMLSVERQQSHDTRIDIMSRLKLGDENAEEEMHKHCKDTYCASCEESQEYKATCLNFLLRCLAQRVATRLHFDQKNGYSIHPGITAFMIRLRDDPIKTFLHENKLFSNLPDVLEHEYNVIVEPTGVDTASRGERRNYRNHVAAIKKIIDSIGRCERAVEPKRYG
jgi:hypothetical protein